jgi:hypothetical protein
MFLAASGAPVAVNRRVVNRSTKLKNSLYNTNARNGFKEKTKKVHEENGVWPCKKPRYRASVCKN